MRSSRLQIKPGDLVLEVGSGNNPNPRSDILCDRYLHDNSERAGEFGIVIDRPFVVADGYHLPFADKTFDYVIASHVLEHMSDPMAFVLELERVAHAGYIETPSAVSERIFGWNFHHWFVAKRQGTLTLRKKTEGVKFGGFFHRLITQAVWFRRFFEENEDRMYMKFEWQGNINITVNVSREAGSRFARQQTTEQQLRRLDQNAWRLLAAAKPDVYLDSVFFLSWIWRRVIRKIDKEVRRLSWRINTVFNKQGIMRQLTTMLACPECKGRLDFEKKTMRCSSCRRTYPVEGAIPVLLTPSERKRGY